MSHDDQDLNLRDALRAELVLAAADAKANIRETAENQLPPPAATYALWPYLQRRGTDLDAPVEPAELCTSCHRARVAASLGRCRRCLREQRLACLESLHRALWDYAGTQVAGISCPMCGRLLLPPEQSDLPPETVPFDRRVAVEVQFDLVSGAALMRYVETVMALELPATGRTCARGFNGGDGRTMRLGGATELFALAISFETLLNDIEARRVQPEVVISGDAAVSFIVDGRRAIRALIDAHLREQRAAEQGGE